MKISTKKKNKTEIKKGMPLLSFKVIHRGIWAAFWSLTFFVSPLFLLALMGFIIISAFGAAFTEFNYFQWKRKMNGKSDRYLTFRKLMYVIKTSEQKDIADAYYYKNYENFFQKGYVRINKKIRLQLVKDTFTPFEAKIFYDNQEIENVKGLSFQKIKWDLEEFPDILEELHQFFDKFESIVQNKKQQLTEKELKRKHDLIQRVKEDYNRL